MGCSSPDWHTRQMQEMEDRHVKRAVKEQKSAESEKKRRLTRPVTSLTQDGEDGMRPDVSNPAEYEDEGS